MNIDGAGYTLRGINTNAIPDMKVSIDLYKDTINNILGRLVKLTTQEYTQGFRGGENSAGGQVEIIKKYVDGTIGEIQKMVTFLENFELALDQVKINYEVNDQGITTNPISTAQERVSTDGITGVQGFGE